MYIYAWIFTWPVPATVCQYGDFHKIDAAMAVPGERQGSAACTRPGFYLGRQSLHTDSIMVSGRGAYR